MSTAAVKRYTVEEYLALELASTTKHEFYDGEIFAMAGASAPHNLVALNVASELRSALRDRDCVAFPSDLRVLLPTGLYTYPDASVVCGPRDIEMIGGLDTLKNPTLIVEILSPSTEAYDLGRKFDHYRTIPSLKGYLILRQDRPRVYHYLRRGDGDWGLTAADGIDGRVKLPEIDVALSLADLYAKVEFPPAEDETKDPAPDTTPPESRPAGPRLR
jgi:Uma2 family endonuclease